MKRKFRITLITSIILAATSANAQTIKDPIQWNKNTTIDTPISVLIDTVNSARRIALLANSGATVNLMGPSIEVTVSASEYNEYTSFAGIRATDSATLNLGGDETKNINVSVNVSGNDPNLDIGPVAVGINALRTGQQSAPELSVSAENLVVNVHSEDGPAYGIQVQNGTKESTAKKATLVINAKNTLINATSGREGYAVGIVAMSEGQLAINGNLEVNSETVISARGDAVIRINESGENKVVLNGNMDFNYDALTSGTKVDADVLVNLTGAESQWNGNASASWNGNITDEELTKVSGLRLVLADKAQWNPTIITRSEEENSGLSPIALNSLTFNNGVINITKTENQKVVIENLQGTGGVVNVAATTDGTTISSAQLKADAVEGAPHFTVNAVGLTSDEITNQKEAMESFYANALDLAEGSDATATLNVAEGAVAGALTAEVAKNGSVVVNEAQNTVNSSLIDIAASNFLFFRSQMNDVSARLGDLRSMPKTAGAWVRYYGGKNKYSSGNMSEKYNTVQLGGDGFINDNFYLGGTFSYTHGDGDLRNGSTDDKNFNFGIYGGWLGDSGQFVDVIIKRHRVKSDFSLYNTMGRNSGSFHNWGTSASVEAGWRLQCPDTGFYVEPQAELQFGRLDSVDYKTNKGVKVKQDSIDSFVGRAGVAVGYTFPENKGNAYAKASVLHDWKGDVKSTFSSNGAKRTYKDDLGGTWGEFAVGGTFNPTKNISAYGQVKTSAGSPVRNPWQVSIGVRYSF